MEFCPECGSLLMPGERDGRDVLVCSSCGRVKTESETITEKVEHRNDVVVLDKSQDTRIKEDIIQCQNEECDSKQAYVEMRQMRSADEAPSRFYECVKCREKWREDS